eukprot:Skav215575  [mRNA]  locus=scaffold2748:77089:83434:- [translate_table: standard]
MPGPWIHLKDNPDFYKSLEVSKGTYLETYLYDASHVQQGNGLWRVVNSEPRRKEGIWLEAKLVAASDPHLNWWMEDGPGKGHSRRYLLHLCTEVERSCKKTKKKELIEFHTDYFRLMDTGDLSDKNMAWVKVKPAKDDLEDELAKLGGSAPRGSKKARKEGQGHAEALDWESQEGGLLSGAEDPEEVAKKLKELKGEVTKGGKADPEKKEEKKSKKEAKKKKKKKGSKKSGKDKESDSSRSPPKKSGNWFGQKAEVKKKKKKKASTSSESTQESSEPSEKKEKKRKASSSKTSKKKKASKRSDADRGPFGVGTKVRFDDKDGSSLSGESGEEGGDPVFRAGLSTRSQHLQLQEYAMKKPGRLASRLLVKMEGILSRQESPMTELSGRNLTPSTGTAYYLTVLDKPRATNSSQGSRSDSSRRPLERRRCVGAALQSARNVPQRPKLASSTACRAHSPGRGGAHGARRAGDGDKRAKLGDEDAKPHGDVNLERGSPRGRSPRGEGQIQGQRKRKEGSEGVEPGRNRARKTSTSMSPRKRPAGQRNPGGEATGHTQKRSRTPLQRKRQVEPKSSAEQPGKPAVAVDRGKELKVHKKRPLPQPATAEKHKGPRGQPAKAEHPPKGENTSKKEAALEPEITAELTEEEDVTPVNLHKLRIEVPRTPQEWCENVKQVFKANATFGDLGRHLWSLMETLPTSLGNFIRGYCSTAQPSTPNEVGRGSNHGDLLPINPALITTAIDNVNPGNLMWIRVMVAVIDYHYCVGWSKPVCVPMRCELTELQKEAVSKLARTVSKNIISAEPIATLGDSDALLSSKKFDYAGRPIEYMEDLQCSKILPCWPVKGQAAIQPLENFLSKETKEVFDHPERLLLAPELMPENALRSKVRATDDEWYRIVAEGHQRGMMRFVDDELVPRDRKGHLITNGAGAVRKDKIIDGRLVHCQRFISIMCPINAVTEPISGSQDTLPYIGQMTGLVLEESEALFLESEDLQSAFNLFSVPDKWLGFFSYGKKVDQSAFGLPRGRMVRPALGVVPMGWHSAVALAGLPRSLGKQLIHAFSGGMQGGHFDGIEGVLKLGPDKLQNYIMLSLALLSKKQWGEFHLRHWTGKTAFMATFKRSLFSGMGRIFEVIERSRKGPVPSCGSVVDEVFVLMVQSVLSQANLRARLSVEISCTDASPSGGGSATATSIKEHPLLAPAAAVFDGTCGQCGEDIDPATMSHRYRCPSQCGRICCSIYCLAKHRLGCPQVDRPRRVFGERFSGPEFPLTKAMGLVGLHVQPPLDLLHPLDPWDFFQEEGKERLNAYCDEGNLVAEHWAPECKTFSSARGRPIVTSSGRHIQGPPAVRSKEKPWGLPRLSQFDQIKVRQGNAMAKRSIGGVKEGHARGKLESLEHPWGSWLWYTEEAMQLCDLPGFFVTKFSNCCFGGQRTKWTCIVHNIPRLHELMNMEECPAHPNLLPYEVHELSDGSLSFDTAQEATYPWEMCKAMATAVFEQLERQAPSPVGDMPFDSETAVMSVLRSSTKGFQCEHKALAAAKKVVEVMRSMSPGAEKEHLMNMLRQVSLRGTDIKLMTEAEAGTESAMAPYPSFLWDWHTQLSFRTQQQLSTEQAVEKGQCSRAHVRLPAGPPMDDIKMELRRQTQSALRTQMSSKKHLKFAGISERTLTLYKREVSLFLSHLEFNNEPFPKSYGKLDQAVANYVNHLYKEGEALTRAGWLLSGLRRLYPRIRKELAIAQQWYNNWVRQHVPSRAVPITWQLVQGFVGLALHQKWYSLALTFLVGFAFFLRTQELLSLEPTDFKVDLRDGTIVLRIRESKTSHGNQQSLALRDAKLAALVQFLLDRLPPEGVVWHYSTSHFRHVLQAFCKFFEVTSHGFVPYSFRRGGATNMYLRNNNLEAVMIQGRWRDSATARLYLDDARATLVRMNLSEPTRRLLQHFRAPLLHLVDRVARSQIG